MRSFFDAISADATPHLLILSLSRGPKTVMQACLFGAEICHRVSKTVYSAGYHDDHESTGDAAGEEMEDAEMNAFGLGRAPGPPWFYYLTLWGWPYLWWPCHWKGVLLCLTGAFALIAGVLATIPFAMTHHVDGLPLLGGLLFYLPFSVVGIRHSQEF